MSMYSISGSPRCDVAAASRKRTSDHFDCDSDASSRSTSASPDCAFADEDFPCADVKYSECYGGKLTKPRRVFQLDETLSGCCVTDEAWVLARIQCSTEILCQLDFSTMSSRRLQHETQACAELVCAFCTRYGAMQLMGICNRVVELCVQYAASLEPRWDVTDRSARVVRMIRFMQAVLMCVSASVDIRTAFCSRYAQYAQHSYLRETLFKNTQCVNSTF
eukprot:ANDGO_02316.mRNA.1 hypothetical protein